MSFVLTRRNNHDFYFKSLWVVFFLVSFLDQTPPHWPKIRGKLCAFGSSVVAVEERTDESTSEEEEEKECPPYGCVLLPEELMDSTVMQKIHRLNNDDNNDNEEEEASAASLTLIGYKGGKLEDQINQDRAFVVSPYTLSSSSNDDDDTHPPTTMQLLGVFDGHGHLGEVVSQYAVTQLPAMLYDKLSDLTNDDDDDTSSSSLSAHTIRQVLIDTFVEIDATVPTAGVGGCTASVLLRWGDALYAANAGDSQSWLVGYDATSNTTRVLYRTREDKPHLPNERARVEAMGGRVFQKPGRTSRVYFDDTHTKRVTGLAMSRSLGDWDAGRVGVVATPLVDVLPSLREISLSDECADDVLSSTAEVNNDGTTVTTTTPTQCGALANKERTPLQLFAVSATDGMMDHATTKHISDVLAQSLYGSAAGESEKPNDDDDTTTTTTKKQHLLQACRDLIIHAATGWTEENKGRYRDDIAISVTRIDV